MVVDDIEKYGDGAPLQQVESIGMDPAMFEKLFLTPRTKVSWDLRKVFAVPTPGSCWVQRCSCPLSICLMGRRGSDAQKMGAADSPTYFWFGGLLVEIAAVGEFLLRNAFALVILAGYGAWFIVFMTTLQPFYNAAEAYTPMPEPTLAAAAAAG
ncbi:uncharacterized protein PAC_06700 [Phialocephala subalpina]|uniref:Uncharacterized protein n=1 Tax=Phialocephala subalpina TaxID=576137 RepID=A0A1L7WVM3_9HELO|nr:uncharacterized protein PAC_06700 [Phialocephala subalpina]